MKYFEVHSPKWFPSWNEQPQLSSMGFFINIGLHQGLVFEPCALIPHVKTPNFHKILNF